MKRKKLLLFVAVSLSTSAIFLSKFNDDQSAYTLYISDVEALSACESIGWRGNDGNCVKNSQTNEYFCKDDSWLEITDCLQEKHPNSISYN